MCTNILNGEVLDHNPLKQGAYAESQPGCQIPKNAGSLQGALCYASAAAVLGGACVSS